MKTFVNLKTGNRYPEHGINSWFWERETSGWKKGEWVKSVKFQYHIKPGTPECTNGWKKFNPKQWRIEEIPDFMGYHPSPFDPDEKSKEWKEYAEKYGVICAQQFLDCCDMVKPDWASEILTPIVNRPSWEDREWFKSLFGEDPMIYAQPLLKLFTRRFSFDILAFEKNLKRNFGYDPESNMSMAQFIDDKWGVGSAERFRKVIL